MSAPDRIHHIGVAVADLDASIRLYENALGAELVHRAASETEGLEAALLRVGDGEIELMHALREDSPVGKFVAKRGPGLHHVAYQVDDIDAALAELRERGVPLIDEQPRIGIRRSRVAFLHPRGTGGVLTEIVQPAGDDLH